MRRLHVRGHENVLKRLLIQVSAFNLGMLMRQSLGVGTPRGLQGRICALMLLILSLFKRLNLDLQELEKIISRDQLQQPLTRWVHYCVITPGHFSLVISRRLRRNLNVIPSEPFPPRRPPSPAASACRFARPQDYFVHRREVL